MAVKAKKIKAVARGGAARKPAPAKRAPARKAARAVAKPTEHPAPAFKTGRFHVSHEADAFWDGGLREYFEYRDLGMATRTGGRLRAHVIRPSKPCDKPGDLHYHALEFQMVYVLKGWARVHFEGIGEVRFEPGSCMYQEPRIRHRVIEYSDDYTVIEITVPADFETVSIAP